MEFVKKLENKMDKEWSHKSHIFKTEEITPLNGQFVIHKPEYFNSGNRFELFFMIFVDDG